MILWYNANMSLTLAVMDDTFKNEYSAEEWLHHRMSAKNWNESPEENRE